MTDAEQTGAGRDWARPVVHWAIEARDVAAQRTFYGTLFSWEIGEGSFAPIGPASAARSPDRPVTSRPRTRPG